MRPHGLPERKASRPDHERIPFGRHTLCESKRRFGESCRSGGDREPGGRDELVAGPTFQLVVARARAVHMTALSVRPRQQAEGPVVTARSHEQGRCFLDRAILVPSPRQGTHEVPVSDERFRIEVQRTFRFGQRFGVLPSDAENVRMHGAHPGIQRIVLNRSSGFVHGRLRLHGAAHESP
jgi:hypothetical protein